MSKESLDYSILCPNYYSSWEDGCCMENCEVYHRDECPIVYVNGLLSEKDEEIKILNKALELTNEHITFCPAKQGECGCLKDKSKKCSDYFLKKAREMLKDGN